MPRMLSAVILGICLCFIWVHCNPVVLAQLPDAIAGQIGLETAWQSQIQFPVAQRPIVSTHLWPSAEGARQYAQKEVPGRTIRVYADTLGQDGKPLGIEWAKEEVKSRAARVLGKFDGIEPKVVSVPRIYLVVVTVDGCVQNFDAETGEILWRAEAGYANAPTSPASVSNLGVAMSHGNYLRLYDWKSGTSLKTQKLRTATAVGVAMTSTLAFVPSFAGVVSAYSVGEKPLRPWQFTAHGLPVGSPVGNSMSTPPMAALVTDKGYLYVFADEERPTAWFRFETQSPFTGALATAGNSFYVADFIGSVFKVSGTRLGQLKWRFTTGSPVIKNPLPIGDRVYTLSENDNLFAINDSDGLQSWPEPVREIESVAGISEDSLYAQTITMGLTKIDVASGKVLGQTGSGLVSTVIANQVSDRIYLVGRGGQLQCLRKIGAELPTMHVQPTLSIEAKPKSQLGAESQQGGAAKDGATDSAAAAVGADPFAETNTPAASTEPAASPAGPVIDPFATPATPAEGSGTATADPFGLPAATPPASTPPASDPFATP